MEDKLHEEYISYQIVRIFSGVNASILDVMLIKSNKEMMLALLDIDSRN